MKPLAWRFEAATSMIWENGKATGVYDGWEWRTTDVEPQMGPAMRNVTPLYPRSPDDAWQPIATAPKDKAILLCVIGFQPATGRWWPNDNCWTSFDWEGHFESDAEMSAYVNGTHYNPTHWRSLPEGPAQ